MFIIYIFVLILLILVDYAENAPIFNVSFPILPSLVLDLIVLVPLYQTMLNNVAAKTGNQHKLHVRWWYGIGKRE